MNDWRVRGAALAAALVTTRMLIDLGVEASPDAGIVLRYTGLIAIVAIAVAWGFLDGQRDRRRNPDPDRGADLTIVWLAAAAAAGVGAAVVAWLLGVLSPLDLGGNSLLFELTSGAAWSMLLVFASALAGSTAGARVAGTSQGARSPEVTVSAPSG
ncbi:B-4DMT family transporter [Antrihabitans sp. YC2-6]|uniref:B-4DMT family transporter n=1 Tax=Antrihabitans sp. YC2-6 TaxID=2799498 RepID=UPI0018F313CA|nr:B-4DMT family transporter [Antrihabitans sp. YC2-6]MBJ8343894.1 B-4DMT family transporter [Antrihabitans sp. YC2-6]